MNKLTKVFEGQEVIIKTDKGNTLINLVHTAKCCGLVEKKNGKEYVNWKQNRGIVDKLKKVFSCECPKEIKSEIQYILSEIENTDDRNSIYMSSWLSKRLALECHSDKANRYKNFLVTMDETRKNGQALSVNQVDPETVLQLAKGMEFIGTAVQSMQTAMTNMQVFVQDSIQSKDLQIQQTMDLIGLRAVNTKRITDRLKEILIYKTGTPINASSPSYVKARNEIFKHFKVVKWEDIPVNQYNAVHAFIEEL